MAEAHSVTFPLPQAEIRRQLDKILSSRKFARAERQAKFLRYSVEQELAGAGDSLKESLLGVEVFGRAADYDPRVDPVVRVEATKLRGRLEQYYAEEGVSDALRIDIPRGGYAPAFSANVRDPDPQPQVIKRPRRSASTDHEELLWAFGAAALSAAFACGWWWRGRGKSQTFQ